MRFSRQEYQSGLLFPSPRGIPNPGTEPATPRYTALAGGFFATGATWEAHIGPSLLIIEYVIKPIQQCGTGTKIEI